MTHPSYVKGRTWDVLAANVAARLMCVDWATLVPADRNITWWTFTSPAARDVFVDWDAEARAQLARLRGVAARRPRSTPDLDVLITRLNQASAEFAACWPESDVLAPVGGTKHLRHPTLGAVRFTHTVLEVAGHPHQRIVTLVPPPHIEPALSALVAATIR